MRWPPFSVLQPRRTAPHVSIAPALLACVAATLGAGCAPPPPPRAAPAAPGSSAPRIALPELRFVEDDLVAATALAKAENKLLFVDAWAPWCHTCLSMKHYVFPDPALRPLASQVVFAAIDTDKPSSAPFLERFDVSGWPSFFILDPAQDRLLATWVGSASARELRSLVEDALAAADTTAPAGTPSRDLADARASLAERDFPRAKERFAALLARVDASWPRRTDALAGMIQTLYRARDYPACTEFGQRYLDQIAGASAPGDFSWMLLSCAEALAPGDLRSSAQQAAIRRLRALVDAPAAESSIDDRADLMGTLADALDKTGDRAGSLQLHQQRLGLLERAAAQAPSPDIAASFDYLRASSYVALGRSDDAVRMLQERERQIPESYEPPARLADVLLQIGRYDEALAAADRAISHAYGPRRLRYIATRAEALGKLGRIEEQVEALRAEVSGWEALPGSQAPAARLENARHRLEEAGKKLAVAGSR